MSRCSALAHGHLPHSVSADLVGGSGQGPLELITRRLRVGLGGCPLETVSPGPVRPLPLSRQQVPQPSWPEHHPDGTGPCLTPSGAGPVVGAASAASLVLSQVGVSAEQSVVGSWSRLTCVRVRCTPELPAGAAHPGECTADDRLRRRPGLPPPSSEEQEACGVSKEPQSCSQLTRDRGVLQGMCVGGDGWLRPAPGRAASTDSGGQTGWLGSGLF